MQIAGRPLNTFYSYKFKGLSPEDGRPMFYGTEETMMVNGEEVKTRDVYAEMDKEEVFMTVMERSGCREPFLQGSIRNYFGWRNWGLNLNLSYSIGSKVRMLQMYPNGTTAAPGPETNMRREFTRRWQQPVMRDILIFPGYCHQENTKVRLAVIGGVGFRTSLPRISGKCMIIRI